MKKIFLLCLLAISMGFASVKVVGFSCLHTNGFQVVNQDNKKVQGFKLVLYRYVDDASNGVKVANSSSLAGAKTSVERLSAHWFKIELDYGNTTIPAGATFPGADKYLSVYLADLNDKVYRPLALDKCAAYQMDEMPYIVVVSSGKILWGEHESVPSTKRIGLLKKNLDANCPDSREVSIYLDTEDSKNDNGIEGNKNPPGITVDRAGVKFTYCVEYVRSLPQISYDYAVLQLDKECPSGSYSFMRHHDTEDSRNKNSKTGDIWPSSVSGNADLQYCFVPKKDGSTEKFPFSQEYGVFANPSVTITNVDHSRIKVDDEDSKNANSWKYYGKANDYQARIRKIIEDGSNTFYHTVKWNGKTLKKEANMVVVDRAAPAVKSFSPEIRGFDHSAVTVELKSAGNVNISIVNLKGAVVANISRENLQPGFHSFDWHSGIVPNGRYVVTVKQNGLVSAKNVILK